VSDYRLLRASVFYIESSLCLILTARCYVRLEHTKTCNEYK
jgi:hypothetical protein